MKGTGGRSVESNAEGWMWMPTTRAPRATYPFVAREVTAGLKAAEDLLVAVHGLRGVTGCLDLVDRIEGVVLLGDVHEIGLDKVTGLFQAHLLVQDLTPANLVFVVVQACDVRTGETSNFAEGAANAAADIQNLCRGRTHAFQCASVEVQGHRTSLMDGGLVVAPTTAAAAAATHLVARLQLKLQCQVVLMALEALIVRLAIPAMSKMKGLAPAILVERSGKVIVLVHHVSVVLLALLLALRAQPVVVGVSCDRRVHLLRIELPANVGGENSIARHLD